MFCLSVLLAVGMTGLCRGANLPEPPHQEPLCPLRHSCASRNTTDYLLCSCDAACKIYGDCCRDSEYYDEAEQIKGVNDYVCVNEVFAKAKCSEDWDNAEVQALCLKGKTLPDPVRRLTVTSTTTARTYVSHYCAICNGEDPASLTMWHTNVECEDKLSTNFSVEDYAVVFHDGSWGVFVPRLGPSSFIRCSSIVTMPQAVTTFTRRCVPTVTTCSDSGSREHERTLCQSYAAAVYHGDLRFRNQHCASCSGYKEYTCEAPPPPPPPAIPPYIFPFGPIMTLDFNNHTSLPDGLTGSCSTDEAWDYWYGRCRKIICPKSGEKFPYGRCVAADDSTLSSEAHTTTSTTTLSAIDRSRTTDGTRGSGHPSRSPSFILNLRAGFPPPLMPTAGSAAKPTTPSTTKTNSSPLPTPAPNTSVPGSQDPQDPLSLPMNKTQSFADCLKVLLSMEEFNRQPDGSVYVPAYGRTYQDDEYEAREGGVLVCWSEDSSHKFSPTLGWVSLAGLCLSCLALVLHLTAFCLVPSLRDLPGKCLASLCLSLLAAYTIVLLNMLAPPTQAGCTALAAAMYYFFLCSFAWMTAIAFDVWYTFRLTQKEPRVTGGCQNHRFLAYSLCSWLLPAVSTAVLVTVDQLEPQGVSEDFLPRLGEGWCWLSHRKSLLVFFVAPMAVLTLTTLVLAGTAAVIAKMSRDTATPIAAAAGPQLHKRYWTFLFLEVLMGLTWTTGILAGYLDLEALWYVFVVLSSLQGVFIFLAFTCRTKVFQEVGSRGRRLQQGAVSLASHGPAQPYNNLELQQQTSKTSYDDSSPLTLSCEK